MQIRYWAWDAWWQEWVELSPTPWLNEKENRDRKRLKRLRFTCFAWERRQVA